MCHSPHPPPEAGLIGVFTPEQDNDKTTTRQMLNLCIPMMPFTPGPLCLVYTAVKSRATWRHTRSYHATLGHKHFLCDIGTQAFLIMRHWDASISYHATLGRKHFLSCDIGTQAFLIMRHWDTSISYHVTLGRKHFLSCDIGTQAFLIM